LDEYQRISPAQVTLAPSGGEGGRSMGAMRWAQSANYGVAPNPAMPRTWPGENAGPYDMEINWNMWENHGKNMGKHGNIMGKIMAKTWENMGISWEKSWQKHGKTWEYHGKNHGKNMGKHGNIMGKIMAKTWEKWEITPSSSSQTIVTTMVWGLRYGCHGSH